MLAKIEGYNMQAEKIIEEGRKRLCEKMRCKNKRHGKDGMTRLARCDNLWRKKSTEARRTGESQEQDQEQDEARPEADCRDDKGHEAQKTPV